MSGVLLETYSVNTARSAILHPDLAVKRVKVRAQGSKR